MSKHILVIEDEYDNQQVIIHLLKYMKFSVDVVASAEEGLICLADHVYDAAIIDLALPGMDGMQLLKQIREKPQFENLPCIVMTAYANPQVKKQALDAGCNAFFPKPFKEKRFMNEVKRLLHL